MSSQDKIDPPKIGNGPSEIPKDDDRLQIDLRLGLNEVAAVEEARLRDSSRRRPTRRELAELALRLYDARRGRDRMFRDRLFGEPAWDMLLALYALPNRGIVLGVMSLGHAANTPPTTGLRFQKILEDEGLIHRGPYLKDTRQKLIGLTDRGRKLMERYLIKLYYCDGMDPAGID